MKVAERLIDKWDGNSMIIVIVMVVMRFIWRVTAVFIGEAISTKIHLIKVNTHMIKKTLMIH